MKVLVAIPAYGRDYRKWNELLADFGSGRDFLACNLYSFDRYFNFDDLDVLQDRGFTHIKFRYKNSQKAYLIPIERLATEVKK